MLRVSTRRVDDLVRTLGIDGISKSEVSRICAALVISDDHPGLVKAINEQLLGSAWQRCRVHLTANAQDLVRRSGRSMVASAIRMVLEQPDGMSACEQVDRVIDGFRRLFPAAAELLTSAEPDPLERLNKAIKRRTRVPTTG